jgi:hypothetical protein
MRACVDIVIRSYYRDLHWLGYCLRSVARFCRGFRRLLVVVPRSCAERMLRSPLAQGELMYCPDYADDYLGQQVTKLYADTLTDADYILHIDSDCVFRRPVQVADFVCEGRTELLFTPVHVFSGNAPWQRVTERAVGFRVEHDYMRRQPLVYPRWLYGALRGHLRKLHGCDPTDYVLAQGPLGFSEFNALGALAYDRYRDGFRWRGWPSPIFDERFCRIHWSWGGLTAPIREELEAILAAPEPTVAEMTPEGGGAE